MDGCWALMVNRGWGWKQGDVWREPGSQHQAEVQMVGEDKKVEEQGLGLLGQGPQGAGSLHLHRLP